MQPRFALAADGRDGVRPRLRIGRDWRRPEAPGGWTLLWRGSDGYGQIVPRPTPDEAAAFYDLPDYYTHERDGDAAAQGLFHRVLVHLAWRADRSVEADAAWWASTLGPSPLSCLEIGCGDGRTLSLLRGQGHAVVGVEPDPAARARAEAAGLAVETGTAENLPPSLGGRRFDCILMLHALEHCIDPDLAVTRAAALLAPGGMLVVEVPNNACQGATLFGPSWYWLDVPRHLNFFTPRSLAGIVEGAGLRVRSTDFTGYNRQFAADWARMQRRIADRLGDRRGRQGWRYPVLLALTALAAPASKYDSVRIIAGHAGDGETARDAATSSAPGIPTGADGPLHDHSRRPAGDGLPPPEVTP